MSGHRVVVHAWGETPLEALERHVTLEPQPFPTHPGPRDVVVEVRSASVGWVDLLMMSGQYQHMSPPPYVPGLEYAGDVAWVGPEVTRFAVGDRVLSDGLSTGPRSSGPHRDQGGFQSYAVADEHALHPLPERLSYDQGCNLLGNYETAYHCLVHRGRLKAGETVLIHGASGATGLAAVHVAKRLGATVIATGRSVEKLAVVAEQGADHTLVPADLRAQVKALTDGVDVVYDGVGGDLSVESLRCVRFGARYLIVGWAATPFVARGKGRRGAPNANQLPTNLIMMKGLDVLGCPTVIGTVNDPSIREARLAAIWEWVAQGLTPRVSGAWPLAEYREAMTAKWHSRAVGSLVVNP